MMCFITANILSEKRIIQRKDYSSLDIIATIPAKASIAEIM